MILTNDEAQAEIRHALRHIHLLVVLYMDDPEEQSLVGLLQKIAGRLGSMLPEYCQYDTPAGTITKTVNKV